MANVRIHRVGYRHGTLGVQYMSHRHGRQYDGTGNQSSYDRGFARGKATDKTGHCKTCGAELTTTGHCHGCGKVSI